MTDSIDWTDETLRPLADLARLAFPDGGVTAKTLLLRARQGKLAVYRPGKAYLATLSGVREMIGKTRVPIAKERPPSPLEPNSLGLTASDLANMRLKRVFDELDARVSAKAAERKRLRDEDRAARRPETMERRRALARAKYQEKKNKNRDSA